MSLIATFLLRRAAQSAIVLIGALAIAFFVLRVIPGDPALLMLPEDATREQVNALREAMGLHKPVWSQFTTYVLDIFRGDFGTSIRRGLPVLDLLIERVPATIVLAFWAMVMSIVVGIPAGIIAAIRRNTFADYAASVVAVAGQSMPNYWLGIMLILVFSVNFRWLPTSGIGTWKHIILPAATLGTSQMALIARLSRSSALEILSSDFVRTARSKGLSEWVVIVKHVLRNALIPVATMIALQTGQLLGGAIITETIFAWPGIGFLTVQSINARDYPMIQMIIVFSAFLFVMIHFLMDALYVVIDPRIKFD